jgi:PKD repeat protein
LTLLALVLPALTAAPGPHAALGHSVARIALSQVGVGDTPATTSFDGTNCDPYTTLVGGSPDADNCGLNSKFKIEDQNEPWCADFAKWVWRRAGVTRDMDELNAGASSFYEWGLEQHERLRPDRGRPAAGDAVVFYPSGRIRSGTSADHVGIVTGVNRDRTVDLVNGDFAGRANIRVSFDRWVHLTSWASSIWGRGEQWVLVAPPSVRQPSPPAVAITGPDAAVADVSVSFRVTRGRGGTEYWWTFGDGPATEVSGTEVSHVFTEAGVYPVTVSATSGQGTQTTRVRDVDVTAASSRVASVPVTTQWWSPTIDRYAFRSSPRRLFAATWDGRKWRWHAVRGRPDPGSGLTALSYPDRDLSDAMAPHAYYISGGSLSETYLGRFGWRSRRLPGRPAAGSAIAAYAGASGPEVFYFGTGGRLRESADGDGKWSTSTVPGPAAIALGSLALGATVRGPEVFYLSGRSLSEDHLLAAVSAGRIWRTVPVSTPSGIAPDGPLAAVSASSYRVNVIFFDGRGSLAVAAQDREGWQVSELPGPALANPVAPHVALSATSYLPHGQSTAGAPTDTGIAVYYRTGSGRPVVTYSASGHRWRNAVVAGRLSSPVLSGRLEGPSIPSSMWQRRISQARRRTAPRQWALRRLALKRRAPGRRSAGRTGRRG